MEAKLADERAASQVAEQVVARWRRPSMLLLLQITPQPFHAVPRTGGVAARLCAEADKRQAEEALVHERAARLVTEQLFAKEPAAP